MTGGHARRVNRKKYSLPPFVAMTWEMLNSQAYKDLPPSAGKALPYFLGKVKTPYNSPERHSTDFSFPYTEAKKYGFALGTHSRVISQLLGNGFIDVVYRGGKRSYGMTSSRFKLSERWKKYGAPDFKKVEWKSIMPEFAKQKPTPKMETYNIKNGADEDENGGVHFQN